MLHGDNVSTFRSSTVLAMPLWLGAIRPYPRHCVTNGNPYVESLLGTAKSGRAKPPSEKGSLQFL